MLVRRDFDASVPHRFVLLGIPLVIWHDPTWRSSGSNSDSQGWRVFADVCPHRLVPLSEGRVTSSGRLECPYVSLEVVLGVTVSMCWETQCSWSRSHAAVVETQWTHAETQWTQAVTHAAAVPPG